MPGLLDKAVARITAGGQPASKAWPMAVASQQKAGNLKPGSLKPTAQGKRRAAMTPAQRQANPP
jgi:hypothetical protein